MSAGAEELLKAVEMRGHIGALQNKDTWSKNAAANKKRVKLQADFFWQNESDKTGVLIAAGPSLKDSLTEIQAIDRKKHEIVAVDMSLDFLTKNGVIPDYAICSDASTKIQPTLEIECSAHIPLLLNVVANPKTALNWKGPIYWFCMFSNYRDKEANDWMQFDHQKKSGVTSFLVPGGNVSSLGLSFLASFRSSKKILLYGHDFCWEKDEEFYCGGAQKDLARERVESETNAGTVLEMPDTAGNKVYTNGSMLTFASWYSDVDKAMRRKVTESDYDYAQRRLGVDVARFGDDMTVIFPRQGLVAFQPVEMRNAKSDEVGARVLLAKNRWRSEMEFIDDTGGYGSGVVGRFYSLRHGRQNPG